MHVEPLEPRRLLSAVPRFDHIVVLMEENHSANEVYGNPSMPYLNGLAANGAKFANSHALAHPSEPNYLALFSGSTQGVTDDGDYTFSGPNLYTQLKATGLSFGGYAESPSLRKHDPWESFTNAAGAGHDFSSFPTNFSQLPTVSFVAPNQNDNSHDGTLQQADTWAQQHIDAYAQWARTHNSLLIVTYDEDDYSENNQVPTIFYGAHVQPGTYGETINDYNVIRTIESAYGLPGLNNAASASPITDVWASPPPVPPPPPPPQVGSVTKFELLDGVTHQDLGPLTSGRTITEAPGQTFAVRASTSGAIGSVLFKLDGSYSHVENLAPYDLFGTAANGTSEGGSLVLGGHTLSATPYARMYDQGAAGATDTVKFTIVPPASQVGTVTGFELFDGATHQDLGALTNGRTITESPGQTLAIRAWAAGSIGSILFHLDGSYSHVENFAPYDLFGTAADGTSEGQSLTTGAHTLTATPYAQSYNRGATGTTSTIRFYIV